MNMTIRDGIECSRPTNLTEEGTNVLVDDLLGESYLYFDQKVVTREAAHVEALAGGAQSLRLLPLRPMSQGGKSNASDFSAVGKLDEGETIQRVIKERRRSGGRREYLCRVHGDEQPRWLPQADVTPECLTVWETGEAARVDAANYERDKKARKVVRDAARPTEVYTFRETQQGKLLLSQTINTLKNAADNRKSDCTRAMARMREDDFKLHIIRTSDYKTAEKDAVTAGTAFGNRAEEFDYIGKHAFTIDKFKMKGSIPPEPTYDRIIRRVGKPPEDGTRKEWNYFTTEVTEVVPLGMVVCEHEDSEPAQVLDVLERHAIEARNLKPNYLRQHPGGKGSAIHKRPKSSVMLLIYGARYMPDAYRAKIQRINGKRKSTSGALANPGRQGSKPKGGSSAADAFRGMFGL